MIMCSEDSGPKREVDDGADMTIGAGDAKMIVYLMYVCWKGSGWDS